MGMYTRLILKCKLKPQFVEPIKKLITEPRDIETYGWKQIMEETKSDFMKDYVEDERVWAIPFCEADGNIKLEGDIWSFECNLKNYTDTIEKFLTMLPNMIEELYECETMYEEQTRPTTHHLFKGKITDIDLHGTGYWLHEN